MLTVVCSAKGSPGVTSAALALAAAWADGTPVLIEADSSGGDLAYRCRHRDGGQVAATPSIVSLAAAVRGRPAALDGAPAQLGEHTQQLACGVHVVPGLLGPSQARGIDSLWPNIARVAAAASLPVVVDVGRIGPSSLPFLDAADAIILVSDDRPESLLHTRELLVELAAPTLARARTAQPVLPAVVCARRHAAALSRDVDQVLGQTSLGLMECTPIHEDLDALTRLEQGANPRGRLAGSSLLRSVAVLRDRLIGFEPVGRLRPTVGEGAAS